MYRISKTLWWTLWPRFYWIWCQSFYQILTKMAAILVTIMATMPAKNLWKIQWSLSIILVTIMAKKSGIMLAKISGECLDIKNLLFGWPGTANAAERTEIISKKNRDPFFKLMKKKYESKFNQGECRFSTFSLV